MNELEKLEESLRRAHKEDKRAEFCCQKRGSTYNVELNRYGGDHKYGGRDKNVYVTDRHATSFITTKGDSFWWYPVEANFPGTPEKTRSYLPQPENRYISINDALEIIEKKFGKEFCLREIPVTQ